MIRQTSLNAYEAIIPELNERQEKVFNIILKHPGSTDFDVCRILGWDINCVTPRRHELEELWYIIPCGEKQNPSGRMATMWRGS